LPHSLLFCDSFIFGRKTKKKAPRFVERLSKKKPVKKTSRKLTFLSGQKLFYFKGKFVNIFERLHFTWIIGQKIFGD
jgi:hypothetical protein